MLSLPGAWVQSLVRGTNNREATQCGEKKKKKKIKMTNFTLYFITIIKVSRNKKHIASILTTYQILLNFFLGRRGWAHKAVKCVCPGLANEGSNTGLDGNVGKYTVNCFFKLDKSFSPTNPLPVFLKR